MSLVDLTSKASAMPDAWKSSIAGRAANAQIKVLRMDNTAYPDEAHDFDEALLVLEGQMNLQIGGEMIEVRSGQMFVVPAGIPHAVASGSHGTLIIVDR